MTSFNNPFDIFKILRFPVKFFLHHDTTIWNPLWIIKSKFCYITNLDIPCKYKNREMVGII